MTTFGVNQTPSDTFWTQPMRVFLVCTLLIEVNAHSSRDTTRQVRFEYISSGAIHLPGRYVCFSYLALQVNGETRAHRLRPIHFFHKHRKRSSLFLLTCVHHLFIIRVSFYLACQAVSFRWLRTYHYTPPSNRYAWLHLVHGWFVCLSSAITSTTGTKAMSRNRLHATARH